MLTSNSKDLESGAEADQSTNNLRTMIESAKPSAALEDYIEELKQRQTSQRTTQSNVDDREQDLILAAELGKALLERNEQLTLANESITEQYSQKLEHLEQEKHSLRRKLELLQDDYESRVLELKNDIATYRKQLSEQQDSARLAEKSEGKLTQELIEQNERLTNQLKQSSEQEETLSNQIISLREQYSARRSNFTDHVSQLEGLKTEINLLNKRKTDLEKRINLLNVEREQLEISHEESNQKCLQLEQRCTHLSTEASRAQRELELQRQLCASQHYTTPPAQRRNRDQISPPSSCSSVNGQPTSLFTELMSCDGDSDDMNKNQNSHLDKNGNQILDLTMLTEDSDEIECDITDEECDWKLKSELMAMYQSMRTVCAELNRRKEDRSLLGGPFAAQDSRCDSGVSESSSPISEMQLSSVLLQKLRKEFKLAFSDFFAEYDEDGPCRSCKQLLSERNEALKLRKDYQSQTDELKQTREQLTKLQSQLTIMETELAAAKEEKQMREETANVSGLGKEEIVKRAFELRDRAVKRKNQVEIELAKTRIECMHINSQLMEAIQQKVELSQQLEQWQVDMQSLLNEQLKNKLSSEEQEAKLRKAQQLKNSANNSPNKNSLTANLITSTTGTLNRNKFLRLFMSSKSTNQTDNKDNKTAKSITLTDKNTTNTKNTTDNTSTTTITSKTNSIKSTKSATLMRKKSMKSTASNTISKISSNPTKTITPAVSVSS